MQFPSLYQRNSRSNKVAAYRRQRETSSLRRSFLWDDVLRRRAVTIVSVFLLLAWNPLTQITLPGFAAFSLGIPGIAHADPYIPPSSKRVDLDLNASWKFHKGDVTGAQGIAFDDSSWTSLSLPHTWNNLDGQDGGNNYYRGVGWYRTHFTVDNAYMGRNLFLQFDGANIVTDVYVNGTYVGQHRGGFATFRFDVTSLLHIGADNVLAVKVNNAHNPDVPPLSADFTFFGGLYRGVHLLVTDPLHLQTLDYGSLGVYLHPSNVSAGSANLQIVAKVWNGAVVSKSVTLTSVLVDANNTIVGTLQSNQTLNAGSEVDFVQNTTLLFPHLWNGLADPYLYTVYVAVTDGSGGPTEVNDLVWQPLGFRDVRVDPAMGFILNGSSYDLHGVNRHQDRLNMGWAITNAEHEEDMALIKEVGATAIRLAHYQHAQHFYDLCDQNGMTVWAELALVNSVTGSTAFFDNAKQQLTELIRQNINHPSIVFWSIANEVSPGANTNALFAQLANLVATEDPTRFSTLAAYHGTEGDTLTTFTDLVGFNWYFGWYEGSYNDFAGWADTVHSTYPAKRFAISEYGAGASIFFHSNTPTRMDHTEEYQTLFHEVHWKAMTTRPFLWGKFVWNMFDFASDGRNEGDTPGRNDKGLVTYDRRTKKDAFYWYKANWSSEPVVYITGRRFIANRANPATIKVYANTDSVELFVNGNTLGSRTSIDRIFTWTNVSLPAGNNLIRARGTTGATTITDSITIPVNATVSGTITLQGCVSSAISSQPITFVLRPTDGSATLTFVQNLNANSAVTLVNVPPKAYNLAIKGAKWLQKVVPIDTTSGSVSNLNVTLLAGDVTNHNAVTTADYLALKAAFGSIPSSSNWNPGADLNCDGMVSTGDYLLLKANFGLTGDP